MAATATVTPREWDEQGKPVQAPTTGVHEWDSTGNPVTTTALTQSDREQKYGIGGSTFNTLPDGMIDHDRLGSAVVNSRMLNIPTSVAYQNDQQIIDQLNNRGINPAIAPSDIAKDIKAGLQGSIFGLAHRGKLPDSIPANMHDEFVSGLSQMVADLPFYIMGGITGAAAGSEFPIVGNMYGGAMGAFAVPAALRKSIVLGIQKGDIKSFADLMERTGETAWAGTVGAAVGLATEASGAVTVPLKFLGDAARPIGEAAFRKLQQSTALTILSAASEGKVPTLNDFALNTALLAAMHFTLGQMDKAGGVTSKLQSRVQDVYADGGTHPANVSAEALRQAQTEPNNGPVERVDEITRQDTPAEGQEAATPTPEGEEAPKPAQPPPPSLRPAIRAEDGTVTAGGEGEQHPDIVERSGNDAERGFIDRDGNFLTRDEAKAWLRENEPNVYQHWERAAGGPDEEFHTTDYNEAQRQSTGVKNASVDAQREQAGLPPIESPTRSLDPNNWEQAKEDVRSGRVDPLAIAESINKFPRGLSPEETNAINYYRAQLSNEHKSVMDAVEKARDGDDPQAEARARERLQGVEDKINTVDQATKRAGTEWGLTGLMRQRTVAEDYSLDRVLQRARVASKNGEVSPEIRNQLESLTNQLELANKRLEEAQTKQSQREANDTVDKLKREAERTSRKQSRKEARVDLDNEFSDLVKEFDALIMGRMSANPFFDPEVIGLVGKMALNRVESGLTRIEDIVDYVHDKLTDIGHDINKRDIRDAISGYGKTIEMSKDAINVALREAKRQGRLLSALEDAQAKVSPLKSGLQRDAATERVKELQKQVRQAMRDSGIGASKSTDPKVSPEQRSLARYKQYLTNRIADLERQYATGNFNQEPQRKSVLDPEAMEMKRKAEQLKDRIDQQIRAQELAKRTTGEKAVDYLTKWRRAALLTSWRVLGKLQSAAMLRMGVTPIEELNGGVLSKIPGIDRISARAPSEGSGLNISAEAQALSQFWQKATADDIWQSLKTGKTSLDELYGKKNSTPPTLLDFIGNLHAALKVIPKRAEFFRRAEKITQWALDHNLDINDPRVQAAITSKAYDASMRAILMQDNPVTSAYQALLTVLDNKGAGALASGMRFIFPIVKVPTNFAAESLAYTPGGLAWQSLQLFKILTDDNKMGRSAMDNLTMHDMDNVMRGLKKGSVGLALMAVGFGLRKHITGYYRPQGKRKPGEPDLGSIRVGDTTIPAWLAESPALAALQLGATIGHVSDHYNMKGASGGLIAGLAYGTAGIVKHTPFVEETGRLYEAARTPESLGVAAGELTGQLMIPLLASQIAVARDPQGYDRKAKSFTDAIKLQIPGLRETVGQQGKQRYSFKRGYQ